MTDIDPATNHIEWSTGGAGLKFGACGPDDELLHPHVTQPGDTLSETWLYMWYVPEERISAFAYVWVHPNLGVLTSGLTVYQGHLEHPLEAEIFDIRAYLSASLVREGGNGRDVRIPNGMRIQIIEPLQSIHLTYEDADRNHVVDVHFTAASPPIMRENERHFDQVIRTQGRMVLAGREYRVDGFGLRDRSWGELRPEHPYPIPPYTWLTGTFAQSKLSWHLCAFDDPAQLPDWLDRMPVPEKIFREGWVYRDGEMLRLLEGTQLTTRDPQSRRPLTVRVRLVDRRHRTYEIHGTLVASTSWSPWPNMRCRLGLARWEMAGEIGWGDIQEVHTGDYLRALKR